MTGTIVLVLRLLLAISLYSFLGIALWTMWQELRLAGNQAARPRVPPLRLEIRARRRAPVVRGFNQSEIVLGRDPLADVPLADTSVSARHALLSFHDGQWWLSDLGSKNGTRLNQEGLIGPTVLTNGDEIKCGQTRLLVELDAAPRV